MSRRKCLFVLVSVLFAVLVTLLCWPVYRQYRQEQKDHALIAAIKAKNTERALELLAEGASGNAHNSGDVPSFGQVLLRFLDRLRPPGASPTGKRAQEHLNALLLLYYVAGEMSEEEEKEVCPDPVLVRSLLDHGAFVSERDKYGETPLLWASSGRDAKTVLLLLQRGADVNTSSRKGVTPLMVSRYTAVTKILMEHGAHIDAVDQHGNTALMIAAEASAEPDVIHTLLEHGAKVNQRNEYNQSALFWVKQSTDPDARKIAAFLRQYGAK